MIALVFAFPILQSLADDQIKKKDGTTITGTILSVSGGQIMVQSRASNGSLVKLPYYISDIDSITMTTPDAVTKAEAQGVAPAAVVSALEPQVKLFAGLPADWVVAAMAQLAQAYAAQNQPDRAVALYNQIIQLYPGSSFINVAKAGMAQMKLKAGKVDEVLADLKPIIDKANEDIAPSPSDGALYASAFLVYGQALEAQKKPQQALEAYLTIKTMFYQNPALAQQADQLAKTLREQNPGLGID